MHIRSRAAATTALLLTASVSGLAAVGGSAQATTHTHTSVRAAAPHVITIKSKAHAVKLSDDKIRPGNAVFRVRNIDGKDSNGLVQLLRLRSGYTLADLLSDFGGVEHGDLPAVKRVDNNVVFYGGMSARGAQTRPPTKWAVNLNKTDTYYVINLDTGQMAPLTVRGPQADGALPSQDGFINTKTASNAAHNTFKAGKHLPVSGWMSTRNKAHEPHFVDLQQVKKGTTNSDLTDAFNGTGSSNPFVKGGAKSGTGVISPGHRFLWAYDLKQGKFAVMCFWPSRMNGVPHAIMGMHIVTRLG